MRLDFPWSMCPSRRPTRTCFRLVSSRIALSVSKAVEEAFPGSTGASRAASHAPNSCRDLAPTKRSRSVRCLNRMVTGIRELRTRAQARDAYRHRFSPRRADRYHFIGGDQHRSENLAGMAPTGSEVDHYDNLRRFAYSSAHFKIGRKRRARPAFASVRQLTEFGTASELL